MRFISTKLARGTLAVAIGVGGLGVVGALTAAPANACVIDPSTGGCAVIGTKTLPVLWVTGWQSMFPSLTGTNLKFQEQSWYCGPASTQLALYGHGIGGGDQGGVPQSTLASQEGAQTHGTDDISNVVYALNLHVGYSFYVKRSISGAPSQATIDTLASNIKSDVDQGWALVANLWGTGTDVNGHQHVYSGGHYVAVLGYADDGYTAIVGDPSGPSKGGVYRVKTSELARWIGYNNKGYAW